MGTTEKGKYVTAGGAKPNGKLILTKSAGIEGTVILSSEKAARKALGRGFLKAAKGLRGLINVVPECLALSAARRHQPLVLPGFHSGRDRTFFFGQYQGFRQVLSTTEVLSVPTAAERAGLDTTANFTPAWQRM
jgi:hypothetical protein